MFNMNAKLDFMLVEVGTPPFYPARNSGPHPSRPQSATPSSSRRVLSIHRPIHKCASNPLAHAGITNIAKLYNYCRQKCFHLELVIMQNEFSTHALSPTAVERRKM